MVMFLILKVIQFLEITCYIFLGSSVIYYKDSLKIESSLSIRKIGYISLIVMLCLLVLDLGMFVVFTF